MKNIKEKAPQKENRKLDGLLFIFVLSLLVTSCANRQFTPSDFVERYIDARGGKASLESLEIIERYGKIDLGNPAVTGTYHTCIQYPDKVAISIDTKSLQMHQVLVGKKGIECDSAFENCRVASPRVATALSRTALVANREALFRPIPNESEVEWVIEKNERVGFTFLDTNIPQAVVFDSNTGLIRYLKKGGKVREYSNWRETGNILLPYGYTDTSNGVVTTVISLEWASNMNSLSAWCENAFEMAGV